MIGKEKASEMFGVPRKEVHHFTIQTPEKNEVKGWICKAHNSRLGSMIIDSVNGNDSLQFVRGMPKVHYLSQSNVLELPNVLNKEDGSNIVMFPLMLEGECIEVLFKARLMADLSGKWMKKLDMENLIKEVIKPQHFSIVEKRKLSFAYEVYGVRNKHEVQYQFLNVPDINFTLLCAFDQGKTLPYKLTHELANNFQIESVIPVFNVSYLEPYYKAMTNDFFLNRYWDYIEDKFIVLENESLEGLYSNMEQFFEEINMNFQDNGRKGIITEGSVWHYGNDETHLLKCKALSVKEGHILAACGIPKEFIEKAVMKGEENFQDFEDSYRTDRSVVLRFIEDELLEEYSEQMVKDAKSEQKILSVLGKHFAKIKIDNELKAIVEKVNEEIGEEAAPADKMRCFAEMYPELRKMSGKVYQAMVAM